MSAAVRAGYKLTEVGVIPEDWEVTPLGDVAELTSSKRIFEGDYVSFGIPFFRGKEISMLVEGEVIADPCFISEVRFTSIKSQFGAPARGDILITAVGTLGNVYLVDTNEPFYFKDGNLIWLRHINDIDPQFLGIQLRRAKAAILDGAIGSSQKALTMVVLRKLLVPAPPLPEQRAIAAALSDVDALLAKQGQLIAKKQGLKQAAMQQLLTGQTRLPGFSGDWEVKQFRDLCSMKSGSMITSAHIDDHSAFPVYGGNGLRGYTTTFTHNGSYALIGRQGALCGNLLNVNEKFFASEHAIVVTPLAVTDIRWLAVVLERMNLNQYSESSAQPGLSVSRLLAFSCITPPPLEQTAIAAILSDIDTEIAALEKRQTKTRALKQGMMQELLTGRTRLV